MKTEKKYDSESVHTATAEEPQEAVGLVLTRKQSWTFIAVLLLFFGALLFWGYKDWRHQHRMQQEFEKQFRSIPATGAGEIN